MEAVNTGDILIILDDEANMIVVLLIQVDRVATVISLRFVIING